MGSVNRWTCARRLALGELRIAFDEKTRRWSVYDDSGAWPHLTDDGVLWVDPVAVLRVEKASWGVVVRIPVVSARSGEKCWTSTNPEGAVTLLRMFPSMVIKVAPELDSLARLLGPDGFTQTYARLREDHVCDVCSAHACRTHRPEVRT